MIWKCLPGIAPRGHFLALRAQGATAPLGPRNDKSESFTPQNAYRKSCQSAWRSASALYREIKPQEGTGAPRAPLTCHCEERSDVAISQYSAASWESYRRKRNCLPEIATSAFGLLAMTSLGALHIRRKYLQICSCQRRSLTAATDAIGAYRFHGGRYGSAALRRARHAPPLQRANSCLAQLRIFVKMYLTFREQADIIKMWKPRRLPQT